MELIVDDKIKVGGPLKRWERKSSNNNFRIAAATYRIQIYVPDSVSNFHIFDKYNENFPNLMVVLSEISYKLYNGFKLFSKEVSVFRVKHNISV